MRWIQLISVIVLTGTVFGVRHLAMPSLSVLTPEQATLFMGKLMPKVRRTLRAGIVLLAASEGYLFFSRDSSEVLSFHLMLKLAITLAAALVVLLLCLSPHRKLSLKLEPFRAYLFDIALGLLIALAVVSHF